MSARWEAATPHRCPCTTYFFFVFFAFFFAIRAVTSFRATMIGQNEGALPSAPSSSSSRPSSSSGLVTSFRLQRSVAHRLAPKVLGLFPAPALVVHEIGVQLRERHDVEAPLLEQTREYPLVVGREQVDRAVALRRAEPEARRDRRRVALEVAVDRRHPDLGRHQRGAGVHREGVPAAVSLGEPDDLGDQPPRDPLGGEVRRELVRLAERDGRRYALDRKSTRLNSSHITTSYAVFCLKKKTETGPEVGPACREARREVLQEVPHARRRRNRSQTRTRRSGCTGQHAGPSPARRA